MDDIPSESAVSDQHVHSGEWIDGLVETISRAAGYIGLFLIVFVVAAGVRMLS
jgi:hypothetical protein